MFVEEEDVNTEPQEASAEATSVEEETTQPQGIQKPEGESSAGSEQSDPNLYDDRGVPWKNVAMENKRKLEDGQKTQEDILSKLNTLSESQQKTYSETDLRAFINDPETSSAHKVWAESELSKVRDQSVSSTVRKELASFQKEQEDKVTKQTSLQTVQARYPEAFVKGKSGQIVGWNNQSPLAQRISQYLQDPKISNEPRGLVVAAALAYSDLSMGQSKTNQAATQGLKQEIRTLQKQTFVEGGGVVNQEAKTPTNKAVEKAQSGNIKDATAAMKEIFKAQSIIE